MSGTEEAARVRFVGGYLDGRVKRTAIRDDGAYLVAPPVNEAYDRAPWADQYFRGGSPVYVFRGCKLRVDEVSYLLPEGATREDVEAAWAMLYAEYSASLVHRVAVLFAHPVQSEVRGYLRLSWLVKP